MKNTPLKIFLFTFHILLVGSFSIRPSQLIRQKDGASVDQSKSTIVDTSAFWMFNSLLRPIELTMPATPGPELSVIYSSVDGLHRYDLSTWSDTRQFLPNTGAAGGVVVSPDHNWIAYTDDGGLKLVENPFSQNSILLDDEPVVPVYIFSQDSSRLVFSAHGELIIYDIASKHTSIVLKHSQQTDGTDTSLNGPMYAARQWSPDGEWLWLDKYSSSSDGHFLLNVLSGKSYHFEICYNLIDWLPDQNSMLMSVTNSAMNDCSRPDGIYQVEFDSLDNPIRIPDLVPSGTYSILEPRLSSDKQFISFIAVSILESNQKIPDSREDLIISTLDGNSSQVIDTTMDSFTHVYWTQGSDYLIYEIWGKNESSLIQLNVHTGEKKELFTDPNYISVFPSSIQGEWILVSPFGSRPGMADELTLINAFTGQLVRVGDLAGEKQPIQYFGPL